MKNAFRAAYSIHHKKGLGLEMQSTRLGLGLEIKESVEKSFDCITAIC